MMSASVIADSTYHVDRAVNSTVYPAPLPWWHASPYAPHRTKAPGRDQSQDQISDAGRLCDRFGRIETIDDKLV